MQRDRHARGILSFAFLFALFPGATITYDLFVATGIPSTAKEGATTNFTNNGFIALNSLNAPDDIKDSYAWARDIHYASYLALRDFSKKQKLLRIPPPTDIELNIQPDFTTNINGEKDSPEEIEEEIGFACGSLKAKEELSDLPCLTLEKTEELKQQHSIQWQRFAQLPNYKTCTYIPQMEIGLRLPGQTLLNLTYLKTADLYYLAKTGNAEKAIQEWARSIEFFRNCISGNQHNMFATALYAISFNAFLTTFNDLALLQPKAISAHQDIINHALRPFDESILVTPYLPVNEYLFLIAPLIYAQTNKPDISSRFFAHLPHALQPAHPTNGFLKKLQKCEDKSAQLLRTAISQFNRYNFANICTDEFPMSDFNEILLTVAKTSGNPLSNFVHHLLMGGILKGSGLALNTRNTQGAMTMTRLGNDLIRRAVPASNIESEINLAPPSLYNPFTDQPFKYDKEKQALYMNAPGGEDGKDRETYFYLPKP